MSFDNINGALSTFNIQFIRPSNQLYKSSGPNLESCCGMISLDFIF